jgi:hypothetical protein
MASSAQVYHREGQVLVNAKIAEVDFGAGDFTGFATYHRRSLEG